VQTTLRRVWGSCGLWSKCKLLSVLLGSAFSTEKLSEAEIEKLKCTTELDGMMEELAAYLPAVKKTLIDERDLFMAATIWECGAPLAGAGVGKPKIVAVMGAGHLRGVTAHLEQFDRDGESTADLAEMRTTPASGGLSKYAGWIIPLFIAALIGVGFYTGGPDKAGDELVKWLILNGGFAALGALLACANVLTVIVALVSAPVGTLNPFLSVGVFAAVVQALIRKPRVADAETLAADMGSLRGVYRNRILHVLLIFFLSSFGGVAGNILTFTPAGARIVAALSAFVSFIASLFAF
jgi:pheromone shutdown-related protein TraB